MGSTTAAGGLQFPKIVAAVLSTVKIAKTGVLVNSLPCRKKISR